jgi:osmoprotectant transport system ATP-binding protein
MPDRKTSDDSSSIMVRVARVVKRYEGTLVLDHVSVSVPAGKTLVLIGPSGCGKSTLLRIIAGLVEPDDGEVVVASQTMSRDTCHAIREQLGYVIQDGGLFPHLTARENVIIRARLLGWADDRVQSRVHELAQLTHFPEEGLNRYPAQLSGGQQQRLGIMRALMTDPTVLLLDEPLAALDPMIRSELQEDLRTIFSRLRKTVVFVTHDLHEAEWFADSIVLMKDGRIAQQGHAKDLAQNPASEFVTRFLRAQRTTDIGATG